MSNLRTLHWASIIACVAIVGYSTGRALAQQQEDQSEQSSSQNDQQQQNQAQSGGQDQSQSADQQQTQSSSQSDEQQKQNAQQEQQKSQQEKQKAQQDQQNRQREQQQRQRDDQSREHQQQNRQGSSSDQWNSDRAETNRAGREWPSRQFNYSDSSRDAQRSESSRQYRDEARWPEPDASDEQGASLGVNITGDDGPGIVLLHIHDGSPAEHMGLRIRDRITRVNGREVRSVSDFISRIREMRPGSNVELAVTRDGNEHSFSGELQSRSEAFASQTESRRDYYFNPNPSNRGNWQTSYDEQERGRSDYNPRDPASRIESLERQVNRLARQVEELRDAIEGGPRYRTRVETTSGFDDSKPGRTRDIRTNERWRSESDPYNQSDRDSSSNDSNRQWRDNSSNSSSSRSTTNRSRSDNDENQSAGGENINKE